VEPKADFLEKQPRLSDTLQLRPLSDIDQEDFDLTSLLEQQPEVYPYYH